MGSPPERNESLEQTSPGHDVETTSASTAHDQDRHRAFDGLLGKREVDLMSATDGNGDLTGLVATANPGHHVAQLPDLIGHPRSPVDPNSNGTAGLCPAWFTRSNCSHRAVPARGRAAGCRTRAPPPRPEYGDQWGPGHRPDISEFSEGGRVARRFEPEVLVAAAGAVCIASS